MSSPGTCHPGTAAVRSCTGCRIGAEAAYQSIMREWEWFITETLVDLIAGYRTGHRNSTRPAAVRSRTVAESEFLRTRYDPRADTVSLKNYPGNFVLLHQPRMVITVSEYWVPQNPISTEYRNSQADISDALTLRHGLSHGTSHAQREMRSLLIRLDPGNVYTSVGEFLLARQTMSSDTWLERIGSRLYDSAVRISP